MSRDFKIWVWSRSTPYGFLLWMMQKSHEHQAYNLPSFLWFALLRPLSSSLIWQHCKCLKLSKKSLRWSIKSFLMFLWLIWKMTTYNLRNKEGLKIIPSSLPAAYWLKKYNWKPKKCWPLRTTTTNFQSITDYRAKSWIENVYKRLQGLNCALQAAANETAKNGCWHGRITFHAFSL